MWTSGSSSAKSRKLSLPTSDAGDRDAPAPNKPQKEVTLHQGCFRGTIQTNNHFGPTFRLPTMRAMRIQTPQHLALRYAHLPSVQRECVLHVRRGTDPSNPYFHRVSPRVTIAAAVTLVPPLLGSIGVRRASKAATCFSTSCNACACCESS